MTMNTQQVTKAFKNCLEDFTVRVGEKYELDPVELASYLKDISFQPQQEVKKTRAKRKKSDDDDDEEIKKCKYEFLKGKSIGDTCSNRVSSESKTGDYCKRHLSNEDDSKEKKAKAKAKTAKSAKSKKQQDLAETEIKVIKKLNETKPQIVIKRNSFGNYEHADTKLVMNRESKKIVGRQQDDGTVSPLTSEDIDNCKLWKLLYDLPANLVSDSDSMPEKKEVETKIEKKVETKIEKKVEKKKFADKTDLEKMEINKRIIMPSGKDPNEPILVVLQTKTLVADTTDQESEDEKTLKNMGGSDEEDEDSE